MLEQSLDELSKGDFLANVFQLSKVEATGIADYVGSGLELDAGAVVDSLGLEVILETAKAPVADTVFVEMFSGPGRAFQ